MPCIYVIKLLMLFITITNIKVIPPSCRLLPLRSTTLQPSRLLRTQQPLHNLSASRHLPNISLLLPLTLLLANRHLNLLRLLRILIRIAVFLSGSRPSSPLSQEHRIMAGIVLNGDVRTGLDERLDAV